MSGFVEAGETLEEAAEREVYEETGIRIRGLKYFGSQPWGFSGSVIAGYTAELDGSDQLHIDTGELSAAAWHPRSENCSVPFPTTRYTTSTLSPWIAARLIGRASRFLSSGGYIWMNGTWPEGPCGEPDREWRLSRDGAGACGGHRAF